MHGLLHLYDHNMPYLYVIQLESYTDYQTVLLQMIAFYVYAYRVM